MIDQQGYILHLSAGLVIALLFGKKSFKIALSIALMKELHDSYFEGTTDILDIIFTVYIPYMKNN